MVAKKKLHYKVHCICFGHMKHENMKTKNKVKVVPCCVATNTFQKLVHFCLKLVVVLPLDEVSECLQISWHLLCKLLVTEAAC